MPACGTPILWGLQPSYHDLWVPWYGGAVRCTVWFGYANGRKCFFIEPHSAADFFGRDRLYGYWDDADRFAFFSKAALEFMLRADKRPDVIHCHDWQTGLVPVLLYEQYGEVMPDQRVCYTIHNFRRRAPAPRTCSGLPSSAGASTSWTPTGWAMTSATGA